MEPLKQALQTVADTTTATATALMRDAKDNQLNPYRVDDSKKGNMITTNYGVRVDNTDHSLKAGSRGPTLWEDIHFREKLTHFDHERIPERIVHARGSAAHGYFQLNESLKEFTCADFLNNTNKKTPLFIRFSTVLGFKGSPDTVRDVRGFAIKFYTDEGNFDLVGNNIPIFFVQDAIKFMDIIHAGKPEPHWEIPQAQTAHDNFWDFCSLQPETTHMLMWAMSDRAIPRSYRMMQGFGIHSFVFYNDQGQRFFVKWHITPTQGVHSLVWDECLKINGVDPDFHRRDLWEAIEKGNFPEWDVSLQIVPEADEHKFDFDILDPTKIIPEELVPRRSIGKIVLNRNPDNFFAETEQVAYCVSHMVPGIAPSNDPLLQGRLHSYVDTQISRLGGPNFEEIPINRSVCPVTNNQRDGFHRMTINSSRVNYFPNRFGCPAAADLANKGFTHPAMKVAGEKIRARGPKFDEHYHQARLFFNSLAPHEKQHLINATKFELGHCDDLGVRQKMVLGFNKVDHDFAVQLANAIGVAPPEVDKEAQTHDKLSPPLSQTSYPGVEGIKSRKVAFLVGPGFNGAQCKAFSAALMAKGAECVYIGPHKGPIADNAGGSVSALFSFFTTKSVLFDSVVIVGGAKSIEAMKPIGEVKGFITEAYKHYKSIAALDEAVDLVRGLNFPKLTLSTPDKGLQICEGFYSQYLKEATAEQKIDDTIAEVIKNFISGMEGHRHWSRDVKEVPV